MISITGFPKIYNLDLFTTHIQYCMLILSGVYELCGILNYSLDIFYCTNYRTIPKLQWSPAILPPVISPPSLIATKLSRTNFPPC